MKKVIYSNNNIDMRAKITAVAISLLQEQGQNAITTRNVAHAAGVQAPVIYRLFKDKDGLLDAMAENILESAVAHKANATKQLDPLADLRSGWDMQIAFGLANPSLFSLLTDPQRQLHSPAVKAGARILASRVHSVALTGQLQVSEVQAIALIRAAGTGAVLTLLSLPIELRHKELADDLYDAVLLKILKNHSKKSISEPLSAAVTLRALMPKLNIFSEAEKNLLAEWLDRAINSN